MRIDELLHVSREVRIGHGRVTELRFERLRDRNGLIERAARPLRLFDHGHRAMILLYDHLDTLLNPGQHGMDVAGEFSFCDADSHLFFDDSGNSFCSAA